MLPEQETVEYEYPLGERMRTFLRLENLFREFQVLIARNDAPSCRAAFYFASEIVTVCNRGDLKSEMIKELDRLSAVLMDFRNNADINIAKLESLIDDFRLISSRISSSATPLLGHLKNSELLTSVLSRFSIPGGTYSFDLPQFHLLIHGDNTLSNDIQQLFASETTNIETAINLILSVLRGSFSSEEAIAVGGGFMREFDKTIRHNLVKVSCARDACVYPEISGNKQRINLRFFSTSSTNGRVTINDDIPFTFSFSTL